MRTLMILRAFILAAALTVPLAQSALAQQAQQEQQATASRSAAMASSYGANSVDEPDGALPFGD